MKGSKGQSRGGMAGVMRYASQDEKTRWGNTQLVSGVNCQAQSAYNDFLRTQLLHHKDNGRRFYHLVQSFPKGEKVDPPQAHFAARRLAEFFEDREVLVCTHTDRDHVHSHLIINAVALESGRKLHSDKALIDNLMKFNDHVCMEFHLPVFQPEQKKNKTKSISNAEYHVAAKGESWKFRMINVIDSCMRYASNRDEFIELMRSEGYEVKWTPSRKNITYTTPDGRKCRDDRLHEEKYLKEKMEFEFRIRAQLIHGTAEAEEPNHAAVADTPIRSATATGAAGNAAAGYDQAKRHILPADAAPLDYRAALDRSAVGADAGYDGIHREVDLHAEPSAGADIPAALGAEFAAAELGVEQSNTFAGEGIGGDGILPALDGRTGWEEERAALLTFLGMGMDGGQPVHEPAVLDAPAWGSRLLSDLASLERSVQMGNGPVMDATTMAQPHADRKLLRKEHEKKIAQGHSRDDHQEDFVYQQSM